MAVFKADGHTLEQFRYNRSRFDTTISKAEVSCAARTLCEMHHSVSFSEAIEIFRTPYMASHCVGSAAEEHRPRCRALLAVKSDIGISRRGPEDGKRTSYSSDGIRTAMTTTTRVFGIYEYRRGRRIRYGNYIKNNRDRRRLKRMAKIAIRSDGDDDLH